ncbi:hypothetical protein AV530_002831 [Patagioenas fasciata monilis]|uniref:Uncharacterized protein n=1 Tax=Patagioenas fasciata monilis TaxID=372326 RepID=A0A1V4K9M1_PATFA|nr:hypothetical protein AV530_002831 [Patagioenas fasciata monilis]
MQVVFELGTCVWKTINAEVKTKLPFMEVKKGNSSSGSWKKKKILLCNLYAGGLRRIQPEEGTNALGPWLEGKVNLSVSQKNAGSDLKPFFQVGTMRSADVVRLYNGIMKGL